MRQEGSVSIDLRLDRSVVFANGADVINLNMQFKNDQGSPIQIDTTEMKLMVDRPAELGKIVFSRSSYSVSIKPQVASPDLKVAVIWKNKVSKTIGIKTTLKPRADHIQARGISPTNLQYVSGLSYTRGDEFPEGQYEGFSIENRGINAMVSAKDSMRSYDFSYQEQATQNISLLVYDAPNGTTSHGMLSHFMFFPRNHLPYASIRENGDIKVTLPNGEPMEFSKTGEVIGGVFEEGPVDVGPDRFTRTYANLKYNGKGILLRANARGQMPQQGQFENNRIDSQYGIKFSKDVLIINGTTGQRCIRPKSDFWKEGDHSPILFKFATDVEFDAYLKRVNCGFGVPDLESPKVAADQSPQILEKIWSACLKSSDLRQCVDDKIKLIEDKTLKKKLKFETTLRLLDEKNKEAAQVSVIVKKQVAQIQSVLLKDASWYKNGCMETALNLAESSSTLRFHDVQTLLRADLTKVCAGIQKQMSQLGAPEVSALKSKLEANFSWVSLSTRDGLVNDCTKKAKTLIDSTFRFHQAPSIYETAIMTLCVGIESSPAYQNWIKTQGAGVEELVFKQLLVDLEFRADKKAQSCLKEFPMDTALNRIKFKAQREGCYYDAWPSLEAESLAELKKDPMALKVGLTFGNILSRLGPEKRRIQLKVFKKHFM